MYKYVLNCIAKISMMFVKYLEHYTIILRGPCLWAHCICGLLYIKGLK